MFSLGAFLVSILAVFAMAVVAYLEGNLTSTQMIRRGMDRAHDDPRRQQLIRGLPFLRHTGLLSDFFVLSPVMGLAAMYADQWPLADVWTFFLISAVITVILHAVWSKMTTVQEHILGPGLTFTLSGIAHVLYMTMTLTVILLFYLKTANVNPNAAIIVSGLMTVHIFLANALVGKMKSGHFDEPGMAFSVILIIVVWVVHFVQF